MRAWDNWNSYLDNDGNLLHGKIRFCRKGTTDDVPILDRDGTAVRNPAFTDMLGRTERQVFVEGNVTAYFYKYVGSGQMMALPSEDYDPSRWAYQYSSDDIDPVSSVDLTSAAVNAVANMEQLRAIDPGQVPSVGGAKMLWLNGYYEAGDTSPVLYLWDASSQAVDDGGAVIQANDVPGRGRWVLATRELHFDVRHFGVFPVDDKYSTDWTYTSQLTNCGLYIDREGLDAWFPGINGEMAYYLFDGTNTFAIRGDIYISDNVRFQCKGGTSGTSITCSEIHKSTPDLFDSSVQNGMAILTADWINISWVGGNTNGQARVGWVIDSSSFTRTITGKEVHFLVNGNSSLRLDNCQITSNKVITGQIYIANSVLKTEFFADDYNWANLTSVGNTILLQNCKDANTYILLKNKHGDPNYGDLGEQSINADVLPGGTIENCYGTIRVADRQGGLELHNASLSVTGLKSYHTLNAVDSWLTFGEVTVLGSIQLRRGSLAGISLQVLADSSIENADIECAISSMGAKLVISGSNIRGYITAQDIDLINNQIYAEVSQTDRDGVINVMCSGNMFHNRQLPNLPVIPARHYIHGTTPDSKVKGIWTRNGSTYDTVHWIRIDRTNLLFQDWQHEYTYSGNSEPYLSKWSGRNRPLCFRKYGGYWTSRATGTGIFSTTTIPFVFLNYRDRTVFCVPRYQYWKMFTVGRGWSSRSGHIQSGPMTIGIIEGDYNDHTNGQTAVHWTWGVNSAKYDSLYDGKRFGYMAASCRDADGEAEYKWSFEAEDAVHGEYSYGCEIGQYDSHDWDSGSDRDMFVAYPSTSNGQAILFIMIDPDFTTGTNPADIYA